MLSSIIIDTLIFIGHKHVKCRETIRGVFLTWKETTVIPPSWTLSDGRKLRYCVFTIRDRYTNNLKRIVCFHWNYDIFDFRLRFIRVIKQLWTVKEEDITMYQVRARLSPSGASAAWSQLYSDLIMCDVSVLNSQ